MLSLEYFYCCFGILVLISVMCCRFVVVNHDDSGRQFELCRPWYYVVRGGLNSKSTVGIHETQNLNP